MGAQRQVDPNTDTVSIGYGVPWAPQPTASCILPPTDLISPRLEFIECQCFLCRASCRGAFVVALRRGPLDVMRALLEFLAYP